MRERSIAFWIRGAHIGGWPVDGTGHTFLGKAVDKVGRAMFPEWEGDEVFFARVPVLDGSRAYSTDGFDAHYAITLLHQRDPSIPRNTESSFWKGIQENWRKTMNPLTDEQWQQAIAFYNQSIAPKRASANSRLVPLTVAMVEAAAQGNLQFATLSSDGDYVPSDPRHWRNGDAYGRFAECQMNPDAPATVAYPTIYDVTFNRSDPQILPGNQWIFVETKSLDALLQSLPDLRTTRRVSASDNPMSGTPLKRRRSPQQEKVTAIFEDCFPKGLPDRKEMSDTELVESVGKYMDAKSRVVPSRETILRAAGRRTDAILE
ncbi:hypothetical protein ACX3P0_21880 [Mesorhizobium sp. A556]